MAVATPNIVFDFRTQGAATAVQQLNKVSTATEKVAKVSQTASSRINSSMKSSSRSIFDFGRAWERMVSIISAYAIIRSARNLENALKGTLRTVVESVGQFERLEMVIQTASAREVSATALRQGQLISLEQAYQAANLDATKYLKVVRDAALTIPATEKDIADTFRVLAGYGLGVEGSMQYTKALAGFGIATGRESEEITRLALALGQVHAKGKLAGEEMRQFSNAGLSSELIITALNKHYPKLNVNQKNFYDLMRKGAIKSGPFLTALLKELQDFETMGPRVARTWAGIPTMIANIGRVLNRTAFGPALKEFTKPFASFIDMFDPQKGKQLWRGVEQLGKVLAKDVKPFASWLDQEAVPALKRFYVGLSEGETTTEKLGIAVSKALRLDIKETGLPNFAEIFAGAWDWANIPDLANKGMEIASGVIKQAVRTLGSLAPEVATAVADLFTNIDFTKLDLSGIAEVIEQEFHDVVDDEKFQDATKAVGVKAGEMIGQGLQEAFSLGLGEGEGILDLAALLISDPIQFYEKVSEKLTKPGDIRDKISQPMAEGVVDGLYAEFTGEDPPKILADALTDMLTISGHLVDPVFMITTIIDKGLEAITDPMATSRWTVGIAEALFGQEAVKGMQGKIKEFWDSTIGQLFGAETGDITGEVKGLKIFSESFQTLESSVAPGISFLNGMLDSLKRILDENTQAMVAFGDYVVNHFAPVIVAFGRVHTSFANMILRFTASVRNAVNDVTVRLSQFALVVAGKLTELATATYEPIRSLGESILSLGEPIVELGAKVWSVFSALAKIGMPAWFSSLDESVNTVSDGIFRFVSVWGLLRDILDKLKEPTDAVAGSINALADAMDNADWGAFKTAVEEKLWAPIVTFMDNIGQAHIKIGQDAVEIGKALVMGVGKGIDDGLKGIADSAKWLIEQFVGEAKDAAEIHSPAGVMIPIGEAMGMGIVYGSDSTIGEIKKAAGRAVDAYAEVAMSSGFAGQILATAGGGAWAGRLVASPSDDMLVETVVNALLQGQGATGVAATSVPDFGGAGWDDLDDGLDDLGKAAKGAANTMEKAADSLLKLVDRVLKPSGDRPRGVEGLDAWDELARRFKAAAQGGEGNEWFEKYRPMLPEWARGDEGLSKQAFELEAGRFYQDPLGVMGQYGGAEGIQTMMQKLASDMAISLQGEVNTGALKGGVIAMMMNDPEQKTILESYAKQTGLDLTTALSQPGMFPSIDELLFGQGLVLDRGVAGQAASSPGLTGYVNTVKEAFSSSGELGSAVSAFKTEVLDGVNTGFGEDMVRNVDAATDNINTKFNASGGEISKSFEHGNVGLGKLNDKAAEVGRKIRSEYFRDFTQTITVKVKYSDGGSSGESSSSGTKGGTVKTVPSPFKHQKGLDWKIPGAGSGDFVPFNALVEPGERIMIIPKSRVNAMPVSGGKQMVINIGSINNGMDEALLKHRVQQWAFEGE